MSDDAIDFSIAGMEPHALSDAYRPTLPRDAWLARKTLTWGGSELAALLAAYDLAPPDAIIMGYVRDATECYKRLGIPRVIAWKAGLRPKPNANKRQKAEGLDREEELLSKWLPLAHQYVIPESVRYVPHCFPRSGLPIVDRLCPDIAVTPDAWALRTDGSDAAISLKLTFHAINVLPWHYRIQLNAELGVLAMDSGVLVAGEQWLDEREDDRPPRAFLVERDDDAIDLMRKVATEAMRLVREMRAMTNPKEVRAAWEESRERIGGNSQRRELDSALNEVGDLDEILRRQSA